MYPHFREPEDRLVILSYHSDCPVFTPFDTMSRTSYWLVLGLVSILACIPGKICNLVKSHTHYAILGNELGDHCRWATGVCQPISRMFDISLPTDPPATAIAQRSVARQQSYSVDMVLGYTIPPRKRNHVNMFLQGKTDFSKQSYYNIDKTYLSEAYTISRRDFTEQMYILHTKHMYILFVVFEEHSTYIFPFGVVLTKHV